MPESFPSILELLPHRGPAVLLDCVTFHDDAETRCRIVAGNSRLFLREHAGVPAWIGLEYMAQTVAAHGGLLDRDAGRSPRPGLFLGSRRLTFATDRFGADAVLEARARFLRGSAGGGAGSGTTGMSGESGKSGKSGKSGMMAFDCSLRIEGSSDVLVSGILNVYLVESFEALTAGSTLQDD